MPSELELVCSQCQEVELCGPAQMLARLRSLSLLRRDAQPDPAVLTELFRCSASKFACHACDHQGLTVREAAPENWGQARVCEVCSVRIPAERLELFPDANRCARCEAAAEKDQLQDREFCAKCGEVLRPRLRTGSGISRYEMTCPRCRR